MTLLSTSDDPSRDAWRMSLAPGQRWAQDADLLPVHHRTTIRTDSEGRPV
jgi:hypothetical protein